MDPDVDQPGEGREVRVDSESGDHGPGLCRLVAAFPQGHVIRQGLADRGMGSPTLQLDNLLSAWPVDHGVDLPLGQGFLLLLELAFRDPVDLPLPDRDGCPEAVDVVGPGLIQILSEDQAFLLSKPGVLASVIRFLDLGS
jgi:hypothetical protein